MTASGGRGRAVVVIAVLGLLAGCSSSGRRQSVLDPAGTSAQAVDAHWQTMLAVGAVVWFLVVAMLLVTLVRRRGRGTSDGRKAPMFVAVAGAAVPAAILVAIMAQSVLVLRDTDPGAVDSGTVITVTGHQFWWEVTYPEHGVVTANEVHIPVGEPVRLEITSQDVVHSVWVPQLAGKLDMVPGTTNTMWLETNEPGTYWGQCAEYCGMQHALMRFVVVAHEPAEFAGWLDAQAQPSRVADPALGEGQDVDDALLARGREVFMSSSCVYCHTVAGTEAQGRAGPDLTHLASRESIAAGTLPNDRDGLARWIVDPQAVKPGNLMPGTDIPEDALDALLAYLESLE